MIVDGINYSHKTIACIYIYIIIISIMRHIITSKLIGGEGSYLFLISVRWDPLLYFTIFFSSGVEMTPVMYYIIMICNCKRSFVMLFCLWKMYYLYFDHV